MSNVIHVTDATFEQEVIKSELPVVIDFWAAWCGPCRLIAPLVEELSEEYAGKVKMCKLDVDNNQNTAMKFGIRSIPMLLFFKNGEVVDSILGAVPKSNIAKKIDTLL